MADDALCINAPLVTVFSTPEDGAEPSNELLYGENLEIIEEQHGWAKIRSAHDGYEGWVLLNKMKAHKPKTHRVCVPMTHIYAEPDYKTPAEQPLYFMSQVHATNETNNGFVKLANGFWIFAGHLCPLDDYQTDFVESALLFDGAPYIWGGRSVSGIDCSGLVQVALMAAGHKPQRDTGQQIETLGNATDTITRGALVYFEGHVGIMIDGSNILNATARVMRTHIEPLSDVIAHYGQPLAIKTID